LGDGPGESDVLLPVADGHSHPLCAVYRIDALSRVRELLADDRLSMAGLLEGLRVRPLGPDELAQPRSLRNLNTPREYDDARAEPEPQIRLEALGPLRDRLGFAHRTVRAATFGRASAAVSVPAEVLPHTQVMLNGNRVAWDAA